MNIFYVYCHLRLDTASPFYVGKGKDDRVTSKKNRNTHWRHIAESIGYSYAIVAENLNEELAFLCEVELIDQYRRLGYQLANYTDGGDGWVKGRVKHGKS